MSGNLRRYLLAVTAAMWTTAAGLPAHGADAPQAQPIVVVVVDTQRVLEESKAGKTIQSQMQQQVATYQKTISKQDQELSAAQQDLQRQQAILAQDAFALKVKEFDQRVNDARKKASEAQQNLQESQREAVGKVEYAMLQVVADLAKERGANLVLNKSTVVMFDTHFDMSDEIIKRLNEKLPAVTVSFNHPAGTAPAPGAAPAKPASAPKRKN
jgi:outer membrane protein